MTAAALEASSEIFLPTEAPRPFAALPKSGFSFSQRSLRALAGVHEDLQAVARRALEISKVDFVVLQGLRSRRQQLKYIAEGKSHIKNLNNARHLSGHAIDVAPWVLMEDPKTKKLDYGINFKNLKNYELIRDAFFRAANELNIPLRWGGDWNQNGSYQDEIERGSFDGGHFELPKAFYPVRLGQVLQESKRVGFSSLGVVATVASATDTVHELAGLKAALGSAFGEVPSWFWLALILISFAGVIWTKWRDDGE